MSSSTRSCCRAGTVRSRGFCPCPVVKPSFQVFSLSSKATNKVPAVVLSGTWQVAGVVMSFLLHGNRFTLLEKKRTNSGPLKAPADKHSISTPPEEHAPGEGRSEAERWLSSPPCGD